MKVYIASPYKKGDKQENVMRQISAFNALVTHGHVPFAPNLGHYVDIHYPRPCTWWIEHDLVWLEFCDALLRLDGESNGADIEVARAKELGIPVFYSLRELVRHGNNN